MRHRMLRYGCVLAIVAALTLNAGFGPASFSSVKAQDKDDQDQQITPLVATAGSTIFALAVAPGLGAQPQRLISFDINSPGTLQSNVIISGLQAGEILVGIDFRPATGQLYALGSTSRLYILDPVTAVATPVAVAFTPAIDRTNFFGFDFNPVPDRIRVIANVNDQNFRLNPNTGTVVDGDAGTTGIQGDPNVAYAPSDPGAMDALPPNIVAAAYSNNMPGVTTTTNFAIDARPDGPARLVTVGSRDFMAGGPGVSPNTGQLFTVGNIIGVDNAGIETNNFVGFDIFGSNTAYLTLTPINPFNSTSSLYSLDTNTRVATLVGPVGGNFRVDSLTIAQSNRVTTTVQLSASTFTVAENAGSVTITVSRVGGTSDDVNQPVTLEFQTDDMGEGIRCDTISGMAFPRCDYSTEASMITLAAGEMSRPVTIFITDDGFAEGNETFTVSLRNVSGGALNAQQSTATVTITDNDTANAATNPIDTPQFFVRQLYIDFLNREPDMAGFNAFVNVLQNCPAGNTTCDRIAVALAFSRSDEYLMFKGFYSFRFYRAALGRRPTYQEFVRDLERLTGATSADTIMRQAAFANDFLVRDEARARFGSLNNGAFVDLLYNTAGIALTTAARAQIVADLDSGARSRGQVLRELVERQDFFNREFNAGFVLTQYFGFLRRDPDEQGFQNFLNILNTGANDPNVSRTVVSNFVNSIEYRLRFGRP